MLKYCDTVKLYQLVILNDEKLEIKGFVHVRSIFLSPKLTSSFIVLSLVNHRERIEYRKQFRETFY